MDFSPDAIRARFQELTAEHDALQLELQPLRDELDALAAPGSGPGAGADPDLSVRAAKAREAEIRPQIKELQSRLFPIEQERACCARALGGKTGQPA